MLYDATKIIRAGGRFDTATNKSELRLRKRKARWDMHTSQFFYVLCHHAEARAEARLLQIPEQ